MRQIYGIQHLVLILSLHCHWFWAVTYYYWCWRAINMTALWVKDQLIHDPASVRSYFFNMRWLNSTYIWYLYLTSSSSCCMLVSKHLIYRPEGDLSYLILGLNLLFTGGLSSSWVVDGGSWRLNSKHIFSYRWMNNNNE